MANAHMTWWTSIETDLRKSLLVGAGRDPERLHDLVRMAFHAGQSSTTPPSPITAPEVDEVPLNESIDTPEFYTTAKSWKDGGPDAALWSDVVIEINDYARREVATAIASRPAEVDDKIPRESNDALISLAKYWKLDGDWMTCKGCRRSLIASRDGEELNHGDGCKFWDKQHPWAQLRELITQRPVPAESAR